MKRDSQKEPQIQVPFDEKKTSSKPEPQQHFTKTINISKDREQKSKLLRGSPLGGPLLDFWGGENAHGIVK